MMKITFNLNFPPLTFVVFKLPLISERSSHPKVFCRKGVLENFAKFTGKHLCQSLFSNKVPGLSLQLYLKRDFGASIFL